MAIITTANCPSCGGPISFKVGSSITVICEFCGSAVARTDRDLRNLGKVADLIDTQSPLRVGVEGRFEGKPFVLTGRVQIAHSAGGVWDEWYASFGGNGWGWLAESQGRFHMTFYRQVPNPAALPPPNVLGPMQPVAIPGDGTPYVVGEVGLGKLVSGQGEIPFPVQPGLLYQFADLSGPNGAFATIDYRQAPPSVFTGREVTLKEMGISTVVDEYDAEKREIKVARLICPRCNAPVELRAPDASMRVTCASCDSLLDVNKGNLTYLKTLQQARPQRFPNGAEAVIDGVKMTLVGFMVRGCQVEGEWYYWEEYLLYAPAIGFRWIVNGEGGWFFVENATPGDIENKTAWVRYKGKKFGFKESVSAVVAYVRGEFYWRVEVGETTQATDYVSRAETLSQEISGSEVNWSFGRAVDPTALDRAFDPRTGPSNPVVLPPPRVIEPKKPLASMWSALGIWLGLTVLAFVVAIVIAVLTPTHQVLSQTASFQAEAQQTRPTEPTAPDSDSEMRWSPGQTEQKVVLGSFQLEGKKTLQFDIDVERKSGDYGELYLELVNDGSGEIRKERLELYANSAIRSYAGPGAGQYTLYAIRRAYEGAEEMKITVVGTEGGADVGWPFFVSFLLLGGPALLLLMKIIRAVFSE